MLQIVWVNLTRRKATTLRPASAAADRWWSVNLNGTTSKASAIGRNSPEEALQFRLRERLDDLTLPCEYSYIDLSYRYRAQRGNWATAGSKKMHFIYAGIRNASATISRLLHGPQPLAHRFRKSEPAVTASCAMSTPFKLETAARDQLSGLSYRFPNGQGFRHRNVEAARPKKKSVCNEYRRLEPVGRPRLKLQTAPGGGGIGREVRLLAETEHPATMTAGNLAHGTL